MFAIVEIYGNKYKVAKGDKVLVNSKIDVAEGKTIKFDSVKAISDKDKNIFEAKDLQNTMLVLRCLNIQGTLRLQLLRKKTKRLSKKTWSSSRFNIITNSIYFSYKSKKASCEKISCEKK